jgi:hypothetical protein
VNRVHLHHPTKWKSIDGPCPPCSGYFDLKHIFLISLRSTTRFVLGTLRRTRPQPRIDKDLQRKMPYRGVGADMSYPVWTARPYRA